MAKDTSAKDGANADAGANGDGSNDEPLGDAGKRALQAERERARKAEAEAKAARDELAKLKADSDSSKSDIQKLTDKVDKLTERAEKAERRAVLTEVSKRTGLPMSKVERLQGETEDDLIADAVEMFDVKLDDGSGDTSGKDGSGDTSGKGGSGDTSGKGGSGDTSGKGDESARDALQDRSGLRDGTVPNASGGQSDEELADEVWKKARGL